MTTWMTPVGVALIVGGITTLIVFRAALFRNARRDRRLAEQDEARRRDGGEAESRTGGRRPEAGEAGDGRRTAGVGGASRAAGGVVPEPRGTQRGRWAAARGAGEAGVAGPGGGPAAFPGAGGGGFVGGGMGFAGAGGGPAGFPGVDGGPVGPGGFPDAAHFPSGEADPALGLRRADGFHPGAALPHPAGPGTRRFPPEPGRWDPAGDGFPAAVDEHPEQAARRGRSLFRRLRDAEEDGGSVTPAGADPAAVRLDRSDDGQPDPGEPADQVGDPELDIDQDLDRAADPVGPEGERSRPFDLPGFELPGPGLTGADADLSGPFDAVAGSDRTGAFSGFPDLGIGDVDETGFVPAVGEGFRNQAGPCDETGYVPITETAAGPDREGPDHGDRVAGWIRPQYQNEPEAVSGEYWTPVPQGTYDTEYGWPTPVERLPEVPPYPPSSGFDIPPAVEAEPTGPVLQWPPARPDTRVVPPRFWTDHAATGSAFRTAGERDEPAPRFGGELNPPARRRFDEPAPAGAGFRSENEPASADAGLFRSESDPASGDAGFRSVSETGVPREPELPQRTRNRPPGRVPARRAPSRQGGPYAAREESLEGPIWAVPDLPDAAMPDLSWTPEEPTADGAARRGRRPAVMTRRRRGPGGFAGEDATQALAPMDTHGEQPRARPRPRPRPGNGQPEPRSTVYVSRHAAEPS